MGSPILGTSGGTSSLCLPSMLSADDQGGAARGRVPTPRVRCSPARLSWERPPACPPPQGHGTHSSRWVVFPEGLWRVRCKPQRVGEPRGSWRPVTQRVSGPLSPGGRVPPVSGRSVGPVGQAPKSPPCPGSRWKLSAGLVLCPGTRSGSRLTSHQGGGGQGGGGRRRPGLAGL